ncbi:hypothetical protein MASR2M44_20740 [Bacteroidota bacterium]
MLKLKNFFVIISLQRFFDWLELKKTLYQIWVWLDEAENQGGEILYTCRVNHRTRFILILILASLNIKAQQPFTRQISRANGLPSNKVYSINQDKKGYIWLGTEQGLVKYDGNSFQTYTHPGMNGIAVSDVQQDATGRIWCQNFIGQHFYFWKDSLHYAENLDAPGLYSPISSDLQGRLYFFGQKHLLVTNLNLIKQDSIPLKDYLIFSFLFENKLHFFNNHKLVSYSNGNVIERKAFLEKAPEFARTFSFVLKNAIYTFPKPISHDFIYRVYPDFKAIKLPQSLNGSLLQSVNVVHDSLIWLNTSSGSILLNQEFQAVFPFRLLPNYSISSVYCDSNSRYWISSTDGGFFEMESLEKRIWHFERQSPKGLTLYGKNQIPLVAGKQGKLFLLEGNNPIELMQIQGTNTFRKIKFSETQNRLIAMNDALWVFEGKKKLVCVSAAVKDVVPIGKDGIAFAATGTSGLIIFNGSREFERWKPLLNLLSKQGPHEIFQFKSSSLALRNNAICYDSGRDRFLIATSKGIIELNKNGEENELKHLAKSVIATGLFMYSNKLVVLTANKGLLIETGNGLVNPRNLFMLSGSQLLECKQIGRELFILSDRGLFKTSEKSWKLVPVYIPGNGDELISFEIKNNTLFLLTENGLLKIPLKDKIEETLPKIEIVQVIANGKPISLQGSKLNYLQNTIHIQFQFPWYGLQNAVQLLYSVNGGDWNLLSPGRRSLEFFSLRPGNYQIALKLKTQSGQESTVHYVEFEIGEPVWKRWWFYALLLFILSSILVITYAYRVRQIRIRNKLHEENLRLESNLKQSMLTSIKAQMNPHFVFNALNSIQSYIYLNDKQNATRFLSKFSSLTRKILEMSEEENVSLEDEVNALNLYLELEKMRFEEVFNFTLHFQNIDSLSGIRIPSMIIQPYVENAIKHGLLHKEGNRELEIRFSYEKPWLNVEIEDNGIGRTASARLNSLKNSRHKSFASGANQKRLELLQKHAGNQLAILYHDKTDAAGNASGTVVKLSILSTSSSQSGN